MKFVNTSLKNIGNWREDPPTQSQLDYIKHIWEESNVPLKPFTGKTKGEAAEWIAKNRYCGYHSTADTYEW